jgi:hypothetical protein
MSTALRIRGLIALALLVLILGAHFHFLGDLNSDAVGSHVCPVCAALGSAALSPLPSLASLPVSSPAHPERPASPVSSFTSRFASHRAPPAL